MTVMRHSSLQRRNATPALSERADEELLSCFLAARDDATFAVLVERYEQTVWNVCWRVLHHRQDVEAASQRTFIVFWQSAEPIRKKSVLKNWLHGVAFRVSKN